MFVIIKRMILWLLWLCKSFTINSDIFLWGSGVDGKLPVGNSVQRVNTSAVAMHV